MHGASNLHRQGCLILHFMWMIFCQEFNSWMRNFPCQVLDVLEIIQPKQLSIFQGRSREKHVVSHCQNIPETFSLICLNTFHCWTWSWIRDLKFGRQLSSGHGRVFCNICEYQHIFYYNSLHKKITFSFRLCGGFLDVNSWHFWTFVFLSVL